VSSSELNANANAIMDRHLAQGAPDPVNVDSHARQAAQDGMASLSASVFAPAQKQIYNLMKFDSFSRFLKSDLYKDSLMAEMSGKTLPFADALDPEVMVEEIASAQSGAFNNDPTSNVSKKPEENRRRSLLPWGNLKGSKDRTKSKERPSSTSEAADSKKHKGNKDSRASLASMDSQIEVAQMSSYDSIGDDASTSCSLARVVLPDKATTVVQTRKGETIRAMVSRLLEKRGLRLTSFDVFATSFPSNSSNHNQNQQQPQSQQRPLDLGQDSSTLGCTEVRVEPRVLFRLELPSGKSIGVKAKPAKVARDVLGPILQQYGWELSAVSVHREREGRVIDLDSTVASIDNTRLVVFTVYSTENDSLTSMSSKECASGTGNSERQVSESLFLFSQSEEILVKCI